MKCPRCHAAAVILELSGVEVDYCEECGGIWLDAGELDILLGDNAESVMQEFRVKKFCRDKRLRCPACNRKMEKIQIGETLLDRCPAGHGLWFDQGELEEVIAAADSHSEVLKLLKDMFADKEIKEKKCLF